MLVVRTIWEGGNKVFVVLWGNELRLSQGSQVKKIMDQQWWKGKVFVYVQRNEKQNWIEMEDRLWTIQMYGFDGKIERYS